MIKAAAIFALALANVDKPHVLHQAVTNKTTEEEEHRQLAQRALFALPTIGALKTAFATVAPYVQYGITALGVAADAKKSIAELVSSTSAKRYVAVEIQNAYGKHVKVEFRGMWLDYGFYQKPCTPTIKSVELGNCGFSKTWNSWTGVYGIVVYRVKHGAPFSTNPNDYWVDFAVAFGNPFHFSVGAKNFFALHVASGKTPLAANKALFSGMLHKLTVGTRLPAGKGQLIQLVESGVRVQAVMSDDYKPQLVVEVWPDTALFDKHSDAWGALRTFYDRECYQFKISHGMTVGNGCTAYWLHSFSQMATAGHSYLGAQEICLMNAACHSFWWSLKRNFGDVRRGDGAMILNYEKEEGYNNGHNGKHHWTFLDADRTRGWGVAFFGGDDCDLQRCSGSNCQTFTSLPFVGGPSNQYKCRWTPTNVIDPVRMSLDDGDSIDDAAPKPEFTDLAPRPEPEFTDLAEPEPEFTDLAEPAAADEDGR